MKVIYLANALSCTFVAVYFFIMPFFTVVNYIDDKSLEQKNLPAFTYHWHQQLSRRIGQWADQRTDNQAASLDVNDISGTEWPMFSSVFYLWATEALQKEWEKTAGDIGESSDESAPIVYAYEAIESVTRLIVDPNNANWVKQHWGDNYLYQENVFYRMLLIAGLTSYQKLTLNTQYEPILRDQVVSLAKELDASPYGILDDYPGQCYPVDIVPAIAVIRRADSLLGTDHSAFAERAVRGFVGEKLDPNTGLTAYLLDAQTGHALGPARGVGMSYMLVWAPELWPELAQQWYQKYEQQFWQDGAFMSGFREFAKETNYPNWGMDVDAGPILAGYGTAASAFGLAAARVHGHQHHYSKLSALAIAASWPLWDGTLLMPRLLSNLSDAPYVGEAALLFSFTREPIFSTGWQRVGNLPNIVILILFLYLLFAGIIFLIARRHFALSQSNRVNYSKAQAIVWLALISGSVLAWFYLIYPLSIALFLASQLLPRNNMNV